MYANPVTHTSFGQEEPLILKMHTYCKQVQMLEGTDDLNFSKSN
jgi:hypothetical protein